MRWSEILEFETAQNATERAAAQKRDNERLTKARQASSDAFRKCQKDQQTAREKRDPEAMADATRRFNHARAKANASMSAAVAKLEKDK